MDITKNINSPVKSEILEYYSRNDIINEFLKISRKREFVGAFKDGSYFKRPNIIQYKSDIVQMVNNGVTSFHCSVERWNNPMQLSTEKKNYNEIRSGWDFLIDIDSKIGVKSAQICADLVCKFFSGYGIKNYGIKFSGNRGFHIVIPFEAFPEEVNYNKISSQYPRIPRIIAEFVREKIKDELLEKLVKKHTAKGLMDLAPESNLNPFYFVEIEKGWGERHLFRAPYSLNEKTWFVSLPIKNPMDFDIDNVKMKNVSVKHEFIKTCDENEATDLLIDALDWNTKKEKPVKLVERKRVFTTSKIPEQLFPPCIKNMLKGLKDGKKRSIFTLINFLRTMNWTYEEIENKVMEWNQKNSSSLSVNFVSGQLNWNRQQKQLFPASCDNDLFYKSIGICEPDDICKKIKNPIAYPFKKSGKSKIKIKEENKLICRVCKKEFANEKILKIHQTRVHGDKVFY